MYLNKNILDIDENQIKIMMFVKEWSNTEKTPTPQKEIIKHAVSIGIKSYNAVYSIHALIEKGYIRKAYSEKQNRTFYVQCRNI
jgi:DNA-binding MarR family transcriptional regulator